MVINTFTGDQLSTEVVLEGGPHPQFDNRACPCSAR